ncbi:hypothetical protein C8Q78DRAFT_982735 [Trametes maxima]|nr:hypothetical protein C8Q78DRAFT_982735 [Trametes maxima]
MSTSLTVPEVKEVQIVYQANMPGLLNYFGPIHLRLDRAVTFRDALRAIYDFFQVRLRTDEAEYFQRVLPEQWREWSRAFYLRCATAPHIAVRDAERNQGMRRVDCLGDRVKFWGLWITHNPDRTWQIQLGLDSLG